MSTNSGLFENVYQFSAVREYPGILESSKHFESWATPKRPRALGSSGVFAKFGNVQNIAGLGQSWFRRKGGRAMLRLRLRMAQGRAQPGGPGPSFGWPRGGQAMQQFRLG